MKGAVALLAAGQTFLKDSTGPEEASLFCVANPADWNLVANGQLVRPKTTRMAVVKCMTEHGFYFVTGVFVMPITGMISVICMYCPLALLWRLCACMLSLLHI